MHTDEQFTDTLTRSLRAGTEDLHYTGPVPTPSRPLLVAAPVAAVVAAGVGVLVATTVGSGGTGSGGTGSHATAVAERPSGTVTHLPAARLVSRSLHVAGRTLRYEQPEGSAPIYATDADTVPADATPVQTDWVSKVALGVDPATGYQAAFVTAPSGKTFELTSPDATRAELQAMVQAPPGQVPYVSGN